jgi:hypothetical protein
LDRCQRGTRTSAGRCTGNSILARRHQCGSGGSWGIRRCRRTDTCIDDIGLPEPALTPFRGATDIAFAPNGRIFICDGYANARILEYTVDGKKLREWGSAGTGPGQFHLPHSIVVDENNILYIADRGLLLNFPV